MGSWRRECAGAGYDFGPFGRLGFLSTLALALRRCSPALCLVANLRPPQGSTGRLYPVDLSWCTVCLLTLVCCSFNREVLHERSHCSTRVPVASSFAGRPLWTPMTVDVCLNHLCSSGERGWPFEARHLSLVHSEPFEPSHALQYFGSILQPCLASCSPPTPLVYPSSCSCRLAFVSLLFALRIVRSHCSYQNRHNSRRWGNTFVWLDKRARSLPLCGTSKFLFL